jgi:hypothetical protein
LKGWNNVGGHNQCRWNVECVKVYVAEVVDDVIVVEKGCGLCVVYGTSLGWLMVLSFR